ncbi:toll/interleukin-1 receptor domain-containing protein [Mucilaginibacter sabulilitoris]|uniref:Toll/interleukin-1 receptor domain-containing protein n=1 Tax=Mucilaginibacter sabulilitoris TaxID=1173583 RepID=A0ABZ0TFV0_9SPHI|nr:toll/interleukin-1 receptor domain-containing protein [Mucilaginibacter sabulilitoris]WPU91681.1 toll/interleukin-1 receptor domain-containing protein [Mucilaginibacter sabulilitoris]
MAKAFISYSHADEKIKEKLHTHLAILRREGKIDAWQDQEILVGANLNQTISFALSSSELFIAIVSPDYLNSNYCYEKEFQQALELQTAGKIIVVPIIAEHCDWLNSPFREIKAVPNDGETN